MTFSIVIPAHNGDKYLRLSIESALNQERKADEIIVVDDASTDNTGEVAQSQEYSKFIKYFYNERSTGFVDAWNRAISKASGDLVTILHQDDLLHPQYLKSVEEALIKYPEVKHIYSACNYIDEQGDILRTPPQPYSIEPVLYMGKEYAHNYLMGVLSNQHIHRCPGVTTGRELLLNKCSYREDAGHIADDDFFLRVGAFTNIVGMSYPLASYREHANSETGRLKLLTLELAKDYVFQSNYYKHHNVLLSSEDIIKINRMSVKFTNLLLFQALLNENREWLTKAFNLRIEIEGLVSGFMNKNLPVWAKLMWFITNQNKLSYLAVSYVRLLNNIRKLRDVIKERCK